MPFCLSETISEQPKRRERKWEEVVFDAKGQMSGADDGVCVSFVLDCTRLCVHFNLFLFACVAHVPYSVRTRNLHFPVCVCVCVCLCVCVCVCDWQMRHWVGQRGQHHAVPPIPPPGAEDAPACRCRHGYGRKSGALIG